MDFSRATGLEEDAYPDSVMDEVRSLFVSVSEGTLGDSLQNVLSDEDSTIHVFLYTLLRDSLIQGMAFPLMSGTPDHTESIRDPKDGTPIYAISAENIWHLMVDCVLMGMHQQKNHTEVDALWNVEREDVVYGD